jgi:NADH dehydrogenase
MVKRVFVTGGSGFVGQSVLEELLSRDVEVTALVNRAGLGPLASRVRTVNASLFDAGALAAAMTGCDAVVHLVGIIMEKPSAGVTFERIHVDGTRGVIGAARAAGVRRLVHMSALGTRPGAPSTYHQTKHQAEELVRASGLDWTILRPAMIHGPRGEFTRMQAQWAKRHAMPFLFMPYFGRGVLGLSGAGRLQPVYVGDVARAFVDALDNPKAIGQSYDLAGPDVLTWPELHRTVAQAVTGKPRAVLPLPAWYAKALARLVPASLLPFNRDQVVMSQEDNTADLSKFVGDFGWTPRPFRETLDGYAQEIAGA